MSETLDIRTAKKIEITTAGFCTRIGGCPIMHVYNAIVGLEDYETAVGIASDEPKTKTEKLNNNETMVVCQVAMEEDSPCGGMLIKKSLLERKPYLRHTAQWVITDDNIRVGNPNFGKLN